MYLKLLEQLSYCLQSNLFSDGKQRPSKVTFTMLENTVKTVG